MIGVSQQDKLSLAPVADSDEIGAHLARRSSGFAALLSSVPIIFH